MANPFLMDDDLGGMGDDPTVNPFLVQSGATDSGTDNDNPFGSEAAVNPFAFGDDGDAEADAQVADIDPAMSFFGTTIEAEDDVLSIKSTADEEEDAKPKGPPPRPVPPQTQELITTVSHQMEEAGSELLGRIPATRSPSPVSMRDLHSPSPTPDSGLADLLDCSDSGSSANTQGFDADLIGSGQNPGLVDNPFGIPTGIGNLQGVAPQASPAKQQPPRPPPPRPAPPRPAPPSVPGQHGQPGPPPRPTPPAVLAQNDNAPKSEPDDLFMFDAGPPAKPPAPKTKEDILSLFDKPAAQPAAKPDLLSDDLVLDLTAAEPEAATKEPSDEGVEDPIFNSVLTRPDESTHNITSEPQSAQPLHGANNRIAPQELSNKQRAPTPDIEITTVEDLPRSDDEEEEPEPPKPEATKTAEPEAEPEPAAEPQPKVEPLRDVPALVIETEPTPPAEDEDDDKSIVPKSGDSDQSPPTESASHVGADSPVEGGMSDIAASEITGHENMIEDMDTGLDFAPPSGTASANPFASPDAEEETFPPAGMVTNIFAADDAGAENIFTTMADTVTTTAGENIFTSMADTATVSVAENIFTSMTDTAPVAENIFTSMADTTAAENIFAADDSVAYTTAENIFTTMADTMTTTVAENIFTSMADTAAVPTAAINIFSADPEPEVDTAQSAYGTNIFAEPDEFDAFAAKFESVKKDNISILDGFGGGGVGGGGSGAVTPTVDAWGDSAFGTPKSGVDAFGDSADGFGNDDDEFYAMKAPVRSESVESVEKDFNVVIRPKTEGASAVAPQLAPPPPTRAAPAGQYDDTSPAAVNPFEDSGFPAPGVTDPSLKRTDSQDTPQTPLFDEDVSQPLEDFPRLHYVGPGWEMQLRQPNKKKITGQRFWKKIFVRLVIQNDIPVVQLLNTANDKQPFQELPLQPSYSVSEIGAQQYDQFGKIFTMKLQYIFYKERPGVRPGQVTKAERITNKLTKFAQYAIAGDYEGVKEFGSDLKKLGLPVEHAPQSSQLFKVGSMNYEDMKQFSICIEEALFRLPALRERALTYKMEEVQVTAVDEIVVEQDIEGKILKQIARVRVFFLAFLTGMPMIELGVNDMWRQGKEVVGRHDIIPVATEEWIRLEAVEFHSVVDQEEYEKSRLIRFQPPDANYIELLRFRVRPPKNRELPLQLKAQWIVTGNKVELRADILVPGFTSRKLGQIPCEDVSVRFPIPECWIYLFRVEKHFRYGSVKSAHRRTGKIKGIERILGAVDTLQESLIEVTSGQAKYEHHHRAIVWRCPRLPKEGQGAYTTHQLVCRMALTSYDQIPSELAPYAFVEFTMPATQVSHTTIRSVSVQDSESDEPPEKYVRYLARHEYKVGIETTHGESTNAYLAATRPIREEPAEKPAASPVPPPSDSDSDSN